MTHPTLAIGHPGRGARARRYYRRIALLAALLGALILGLAVLAARGDRGRGAAPPDAAAPRCADETGADTVAVTTQTPQGPAVPRDSAITATFSCPVDHRAVERAFVLYPPVKGAFTWAGQTLVFTPAEPLQPRTAYRVTLFGGLSDARGYVDGRKGSWPFITDGRP